MFVVTGGGSGIGKALALALAARGKSVLIIGRQKRSLMDVSDSSDLIDYFVSDVSTIKGRQLIVNHLREFGPLQGLIHNAGIIDPIMALGKIEELEWQRLMATNVTAPLFLNQQLMQQLPQGRVLHIGSGAAHFPISGWAAYCVSKAALLMLTRCWQLECTTLALASVMPGIIDTEMMTTICQSDQMHPDKLNFFRQLKQNNQLLSPETVALFLCWLLLDIETSVYVSKEWDIYDTSHHLSWLPKSHVVPALDLT